MKQNSPDGSHFDATESGPLPSSPAESVAPRATGSTPSWVWVAGGCGCVAIVFLVMIPLLIALLLPAVQAVRDASRRVHSLSNLKEIGLANFSFEMTNKRFPASCNMDENGRPLLSWRVHLLPYLEHDVLYQQFRLDEPWNSPHNQALIPLMPDVYRSPFSQAPEGHTTYLGNAGERGTFAKPSRSNGELIVASTSGYSFDDISDGLEHTWHVLEVQDEHAIPWTQPADFDPPPGTDLSSWLRKVSGRGFLVLYCDGSTDMEAIIDNELIHSKLTRDGGEVGEFEILPGH